MLDRYNLRGQEASDDSDAFFFYSKASLIENGIQWLTLKRRASLECGDLSPLYAMAMIQSGDKSPRSKSWLNAVGAAWTDAGFWS